VRYGSIDSLPKPDVYLPWAQSPNGRPMLLVRTALPPLTLAEPLRRTLHDIAPDAPVFDIRTMEDRIAGAMAFQRFSATLLALFAAVALALATLGVYGIIASAVTQRRGEIGVRVALGATRGAIVQLVVAQGIRIAAMGTAIGLLGAFAATRVMRSLLYDVTPSDPATFAGIIVVLLVAVLLASWIPAWRAASVRPTEALREA
jgi:ABC-type antimicrobial peptide transport system permease subunit